MTEQRNRIRGKLSRTLIAVRRLVQKVHGDEDGSISIASVFSFIFLTMVLGMVINIGRHADRKVKMQNGADAATLSGGVLLARSMNTMAFTNHLLCDVFALTAYLREARDRNAETGMSPILDAWDEMADDFEEAPFAKFRAMQPAIPGQTPLERDLIQVFGDQNAAVSEQLLGVLEEILEREMIPEFQRALHVATPRIATLAANEIAGRHGPDYTGLSGGEAMTCSMWRTDAELFDSQAEMNRSTLPVADPVYDQTVFKPEYMAEGRIQRKHFAEIYLRMLNRRMLGELGELLKMSQFVGLWRAYTHGYLDELLREYPNSNIPYQLRKSELAATNPNQYIEQEYMFVGVANWKSMPERLPGLFENPVDADNAAFAQIRLYIARNRLVYDPTEQYYDQVRREYYYWVYDYVLERWRRVGYRLPRNLMTQRWTTQIVPATSASVPTIVQTTTPDSTTTAPDLGGLTVEEFRRLNTH